MFQAPRGTTDLLPEEQKYWRYIRSKATDLAHRYGYGRIDSPVFEDSGLFIRSVGEGTDISGDSGVLRINTVGFNDEKSIDLSGRGSLSFMLESDDA